MKHIYLIIFSLFIGISYGQMNYPGNGNGGFGDVIGSSNLNINDDGTTITFTLTKGIGNFNDALVLYIDTGIPGRSVIDGMVNDQADPLRKAISNEDINNSTLITFPSGFEASHAIGLEVGFAGLWSIPSTGMIGDNGLGFVDSANTDLITADQAVCSFSIDWTELGLTSSSSFDFVGIYLNPGNAFTSDEGYGDGIPPGNPGGGSITYTGGRTYSNTLSDGTQELNDFNVTYANSQLNIKNLNGYFDLRIYDMLGRAIISLESELITPHYVRSLILEKGQIYILQIQNDSFRKH